MKIINQPQYTVGLGLSGGGAKGIAHIGVIKALLEHDLKPEIISGVSAGAIVGALYADGKSPDEMLAFFKEARFFKFVNIVMPKLGLMSSERFETILKSYITAKTFEDLHIPLQVNATELIEGKNVFFTSGTLIDKVVASASVPIFLKPKIIGNRIYVDGGIFNNMPCNNIRENCKLLIGCHVNPIMPEKMIDGVIDVAERIYNLSIQSSTISEKKICDIVIEPTEAKQFGMFDTSNTQKIFDIGYSHAMKKLEKERKLIDEIITK